MFFDISGVKLLFENVIVEKKNIFKPFIFIYSLRTKHYLFYI